MASMARQAPMIASDRLSEEKPDNHGLEEGVQSFRSELPSEPTVLHAAHWGGEACWTAVSSTVPV